jgi:hypothetical protein
VKQLLYRLKVIKEAGAAEAWLKKSDRKLEEAFKEEAKKAPESPCGWKALGALFLFVGAFLSCGTAAYAVEHNFSFFPLSGWISSGLLVLSGISFWLDFLADKKWKPKIKAYKKAARDKLEGEREQDPFYQRAKLIQEALGNYRSHCDRYHAWYELVDRGLEDADERAADRYYAMLERAHAVIKRAVQNFARATERAEEIESFAESHPAIRSEPQSTALNQLIALLDEPMEMPDAPQVKDPRDALEYEDALRELSGELGEKRDDLAQFDARLARVRVEHPEQADDPAPDVSPAIKATA